MKNRVIKFRAWSRSGDWEDDGEKRKFIMIPSDKLATSGEYMLLSESLKDIDDEIYFMQFTGLTDKNGKEIYEGDIVTTNGGCKAEVIFQENSCEFILQEFADGRKYLDWFDRTEMIKNGEVIGNIFENPELLQ